MYEGLQASFVKPQINPVPSTPCPRRVSSASSPSHSLFIPSPHLLSVMSCHAVFVLATGCIYCLPSDTTTKWVRNFFSEVRVQAAARGGYREAWTSPAICSSVYCILTTKLVSLSVCLSPSLCLSLFLYVRLSFSLPVCLSVSLSLPPFLFPPLSVSSSLCLFLSLSLSVSVSVSLPLSHSVTHSLLFSLSLSLSLFLFLFLSLSLSISLSLQGQLIQGVLRVNRMHSRDEAFVSPSPSLYPSSGRNQPHPLLIRCGMDSMRDILICGSDNRCIYLSFFV